MPDYPTGAGISASDLKTAFDSEAEGLQDDLNRSLTELEDTTAAASLGAAALIEGDTSSGNVQAKLEYLQGELQDIALGDIPDGTITQAKMNETYEGTLAKKDGTLQTGLNGEKLNSKTEAQLKTSFLGTANPTTLSFTGATKRTATTTETKTMTTASRYLFMLFGNYGQCHIGLYDVQTMKFVFASYMGGYPAGGDNTSNTFAFNAANIKLRDGKYNGTVTLSITKSEDTLSFNMTKAPSQSSSGNNIPAGTITVFELGGIVQ
jgi:hypothetical protein